MTNPDYTQQLEVLFGKVAEVTDNGFLVVVDPNRDHHYVTHNEGWTIEKLTPNYEQQVRDLEPGTAFEVTYTDGEPEVFLRVVEGVADKDTSLAGGIIYDFSTGNSIGVTGIRVLA